MKITKIPSPDEALTELLPLTSALYDYFPEARRTALAFFIDRGRKINSTLFACIIRYEVKESLLQLGITVEDENEEIGFQNINIPMERVANNGIEGSFNLYQFKLLKSDDGLLPIPQSDNKKAYYGQQLRLELEDVPPEAIRPNVVILWSFDSQGVVHLSLSVPKEGGNHRYQVKDHYTVSIPHPATVIQPKLIAEPKEPITEPEITVKEIETKYTESVEEKKA